jgi:polyisoprenyl-phosphate glycosyltransferase
MTNQIKSLTLIVPCLNEGDNIPLFVNRVLEIRKSSPNINFRIMFVDDGSTDKSREIIKKLSKDNTDISYVFLTRNFGAHLALLAGLDSSFTDSAVLIPCDQVDNLNLVSQMIEHTSQGAEVVMGKRTNKSEAIINRLFSSAFYSLFNLTGDIKLPPGGSDFVLITKRPMNFLRKNKEYNTNIFMLLLWPGFKSVTFEYKNIKRATGPSKWTFGKRLTLAMDSFFGFSMMPLRIITLAGSLLSTFSFLFLIYTIFLYLTIGTPVPGIPTVICIIVLGFGVTFLALGVMAEYLFRDLDFSRKRPIFVIDEQSDNND